MTSEPSSSGADPDDVRAEGPTGSMPRWVKVSLLAALAVILVLALFQHVGGDHGPGRHSGGADPTLTAA